MRVLAIFTAILAVAYAAPSMEKRQQGENCREIFFPDNCGAHGLVECDGAGSIRICCQRSILLALISSGSLSSIYGVSTPDHLPPTPQSPENSRSQWREMRIPPGAHPWRKNTLQYLSYTIGLPFYDPEHRYCLEKRKEHRDNLVSFQNGLTWQHGNGEHRWIYWEYNLSIDAEEDRRLPMLNCVDKLLVSMRGQRVHPLTIRKMVLTLPNLRALDLRFPAGHAKNRALKAEYRASLAGVLKAPALHRLEVLGIAMDEETPRNHDFNTALEQDPFF
ncbi:hypothetical protein BJX61DRAFT_542949 [Aspergillus egyptiacus]|nr:hypothetical protein BJX61DRAFT_542949 [Aspergillus egyptiacus]